MFLLFKNLLRHFFCMKPFLIFARNIFQKIDFLIELQEKNFAQFQFYFCEFFLQCFLIFFEHSEKIRLSTANAADELHQMWQHSNPMTSLEVSAHVSLFCFVWLFYRFLLLSGLFTFSDLFGLLDFVAASRSVSYGYF